LQRYLSGGRFLRFIRRREISPFAGDWRNRERSFLAGRMIIAPSVPARESSGAFFRFYSLLSPIAHVARLSSLETARENRWCVMHGTAKSLFAGNPERKRSPVDRRAANRSWRTELQNAR